MKLYDVTFFLRYYVQSMRRGRRSCVLVLAKVMCHCQLSQRKALCGRKLIKLIVVKRIVTLLLQNLLALISILL